MDMSGTHPLPNDTISLMTGNSQVFDFTSPIERVSIANSKIADIQVVSPRQLLLVGHKPGFTTLVVWNTFGQYEQRQVRIEQTGHQQVMLNVVVAEVNRTKIEQQGVDLSVALKKIGISLASLPGNVASPYTTQLGFIGSPASNLLSFAPPGGTAFPLLLSNNITYALAAQNPNVSTNSFFQFLESHDLVRILAQPRILANSGEKAQFLSGGEIPIVIAQALNTSIVFKQFGTSVIFVPTVVGRHEIELRVKPEVSKPDYSQGVQLFGFTVPAFVTQRAETDVRMRENQTVIIAGLILDNNQATVKKVPYLGDAPYVGALFRNTYYDHVRTELVMSVTPRIVGALPPGGQVALPTERGSFTTEEIRTEELDAADPSRPRF
jgi:pilus assembly protein CpaC